MIVIQYIRSRILFESLACTAGITVLTIHPPRRNTEWLTWVRMLDISYDDADSCSHPNAFEFRFLVPRQGVTERFGLLRD
jgi:hypothetical protein